MFDRLQSEAMKESTKLLYGDGDTTYRALGEEQGIRQLVDHFYDLMSSDPTYQTIWHWHVEDRETMRDKLAVFLSGWTGGPRLYKSKYGAIGIPRVHAHLKVGSAERDQWLQCMRGALVRNEYPAELVEYMIRQLSIPAERVRQTCEKIHGENS